LKKKTCKQYSNSNDTLKNWNGYQTSNHNTKLATIYNNNNNKTKQNKTKQKQNKNKRELLFFINNTNKTKVTHNNNTTTTHIYFYPKIDNSQKNHFLLYNANEDPILSTNVDCLNRIFELQISHNNNNNKTTKQQTQQQTQNTKHVIENQHQLIL